MRNSLYMHLQLLVVILLRLLRLALANVSALATVQASCCSIFSSSTEMQMQDCCISLSPLLQGRMRMGQSLSTRWWFFYSIHTCSYFVHTCLYSVHCLLYWFSTFMCVFQHAHIENIKTVANLLNKKDVSLCILCFHAFAGDLQHY